MFQVTENLQELEEPLPSAVQRSDWWVKARCNDNAGTLVALFFSEDLLDIARAKAICSRCAVSSQCLSDALERREPWGVWGGELLVAGRVVISKRRRGRPSKHARPELVVDEIRTPDYLASA